MKSLIIAALFVAGMSGAAFAEDAMAPAADAMAPMASDAMAPAADMANTMMTPNQMMEACMKNAGMLSGMDAQEAGKKTCHDAFALAMGDMAMAPMGGDAVAPMATDGMAADPAATKPAM